MKLALAQMKMDREREKNLNHSLALLEQAGNEQADLIFYPEVQLSPFFAVRYSLDDRFCPPLW